MTKQELIDDIAIYLKTAPAGKTGSFEAWAQELLVEAQKHITRNT